MASGQLSSWGYDLIKAFEGWQGDFYCDKALSTTRGHTTCLPGEGTLTIGWGHACQPEAKCDRFKNMTRPISKACGMEILTKDVTGMEDAVTAAGITFPVSVVSIF